MCFELRLPFIILYFSYNPQHTPMISLFLFLFYVIRMFLFCQCSFFFHFHFQFHSHFRKPINQHILYRAFLFTSNSTFFLYNNKLVYIYKYFIYHQTIKIDFLHDINNNKYQELGNR